MSSINQDLNITDNREDVTIIDLTQSHGQGPGTGCGITVDQLSSDDFQQLRNRGFYRFGDLHKKPGLQTPEFWNLSIKIGRRCLEAYKIN